MMYTVKQLADLAGVSARTLHYYDEIDLLKPAAYGENGYRYYDAAAVLRLQQIMFYRELDFSLSDIRLLLDQPDFDVAQALTAHRSVLQRRAARFERLIHTIDRTLEHLKGVTNMTQADLFDGFTDAKQAQYEQDVRARWGDNPATAESFKRWGSYSAAQKDQIKAEGGTIYQALAAAMSLGYDSPEVQALIARWHQHLRHFYEPTPEILRGLGQGYAEHPDFRATFQKIHPDLPEFLQQAITYYCDRL